MWLIVLPIVYLFIGGLVTEMIAILSKPKYCGGISVFSIVIWPLILPAWVGICVAVALFATDKDGR